VFLVDDNFVARRGLRSVLEAAESICVVGEASSGSETVARLKSCQADVVLMDFRMPDIDGVKVTIELLRHNPKLIVLLATVIDDPMVHMKALLAGVKGFMVYGYFTPEELVEGIRAVACGMRVCVPQLSMATDGVQFNDIQDTLTQREEEILNLIADGYDNRQIASELNIEEKTVKNHINNLYSKIGATCRHDAVYYSVCRMLKAYP